MAVKMKLQFNNAGFRKLLKHEAVQRKLREEAEKLAKEAGSGFKAAKSFGRTKRPRVGVYADTQAAMKAEATNRSLTRAIGRRSR